MNLQRLLLLQAVLTFSSFVVLLVAPAMIPASLGLTISPGQYFFSYAIAAFDGAVAYLSLALRTNKDPKTRRILSVFFMIFHGATGLFAIYAFWQGGSPKLLGNVAFRIIPVVLFYYYGLARQPLLSKLYSSQLRD